MNLKPIQRLGGGFFGQVWHMEDTALQRDLAVKFIDLSKLGRPASEMFAEAQAIHEAEHDNVVRVYAAEEYKGTPVIAMEYLPNGSVEDRHGGRPAPVRAALETVAQACRGLAHAHTRGLLHRDIKPGNLLIASDGTVKLSDFGLSCSAASVASAPSIGYLTHLPPEAVDQGYISDALGDIYAIGATLYRLLNGDRMFHGAAVAGQNLDALVKAGKFPRRDWWQLHVPPNVKRVVRSLMNIDPAKRPQNANDARHRIESVYPVISFERSTSNPAEWHGFGSDGADQWHAYCQQRRRAGDFKVEVRKGRAGQTLRRVGDDCRVFDKRAEALAHVADVLHRVAVNGR